jgi:hypothetical protein
VKTPLLAVLLASLPCHGEPPISGKPAIERKSASQTPADLFENLSEATKPHWRLQYRRGVVTAPADRRAAACCVGVVLTDLALACSARDAQHLKNLGSELGALQKALGTREKMASAERRVIAAAESGEWPLARREVESAARRLHELLDELGDQGLAPFVEAGRWTRAWQVASKIALDRQLVKQDQLAIGDPAIIADLVKTLESAETGSASEKCLREMLKRLRKLRQLWSQPAEAPTDRLKASVELLNACMAPLQAEP